MNDFLAFRTMITPVIIQIIFWVGVVLCLIVGFTTMFVGGNYYGSGGGALAGFLIVVLGPVVVRIYCEILIIFFRINETLTEIKHELAARRTP